MHDARKSGLFKSRRKAIDQSEEIRRRNRQRQRRELLQEIKEAAIDAGYEPADMSAEELIELGRQLLGSVVA